MADQDELSSILDRILAGDLTEADIEKLRQSLRVDGNLVQLVSQDGKLNTNIGKIEGGTFHIGDVYYGADSENIEQIFLEILSSQLQKLLTSPTVDTKAALILSSDWLLSHLQKMENEFVEHMCSIEESTTTQATDRYVELLVQERKKVEEKEQRKTEPKEGALSQFATCLGCRLLVFGGGGSGKTTSLLKLAADAAVSARTNPNAPIPFYVKLNFFDTSEKSFEQLLKMLGEAANLSSEEVNALWQQGHRPLLFLLDGFNEVGQSFQESCRLALEKLMRESFHLYVITSRPTVEAEQLTKQIRGIKVLDILQLHDEQMESFLASHGAAQIYERMGNQLKGLVRNPFMLWALVQSCSGLAQGELPRNKGQLYQNFIDYYIFSEREASKVPPPTRYDYERVKRQILAQLAYQMTDQSETRIVLDDTLEDHLINWLEAIDTRNKRRRKEVMPDDWSAEDFLNETALNGVLRQFRNTLEFMHQSVQNYFVAVYLDSVSFDHADFYKCLSHISWDNTDNVWDEVITFFSGITSDLNRLIETLIEQDLFLAASCAGSRSETLTSDVTTLLFEAIDRLDLETIDNPIKFYGFWWEKVIAAYQQTLLLVEEDSAGWAILQAKLGLAYTDRILEKTAENLETAIQHCQAALKVFTPKVYPEKWADTQNSLGNAYRERIKGEWHENLELATECYQLALRVRNRETLPIKWAVTQKNLGETYSKRIRGDRGENLEQAINCYQLALQVFTQGSFPQLWAQTHLSLGGAYCERIRGERAKNLEHAIEYYHSALQVFSQEAFPQRWAEACNSLGNAYCERVRGDRAENLEHAIEYYQLALQVFTQEVFPQRWAECLNNLSNAYGDRIRGGKAENLEKAIHSLMLALKVFTPEDFPQQWAEAFNRMGNAYRERVRGDRVDNLEHAIDAYMRSLQVRTRDALPLQWAETIANLGNAYWERIRGDRGDNLEQAIVLYQQALTVRIREALPLQWAETLWKLGNAYRERIRGDRSENIEQAIACYQQALTVRTREALPLDWAETIANLGNAYLKRIRGDRSENIEQAIACYQQALTVRTCEALPLDWAETMNNLASAYFDRIWGDRAQNIEEAISAYQSSLEVFVPEVLPNDCRRTARSLGNLYFWETRWQEAVTVYQLVLQAAETLYQSANLLDSKAAELAETADLPRRAAYALARTGQYLEAVETLEQGRARGLSESIDRDRADLTQLQQIHPELYNQYKDLTNQLRNLESQQRDRSTSSDQHSITPESLRESAIALRQQLNTLIQAIRQVLGYEKFLTLPTFDDVRQAVKSDGPLVYLVSTSAGSLALIVASENIQAIWLNDLIEANLIDLFDNTWLDAYRQFQSNRQGWFDAIDFVTRQLWEPLMEPLIHHLKTHNFHQVTLIPTGLLSFLQLHAAWTEDISTPTGRRYALDEILFTYAPNARSITAAEAIADRVQADSILAIDNPSQDLPNSAREVNAAIASFPQRTVIRHTKATIEAVRSQLSEAAIAHFSCHGTANLREPLNSGLAMSDGILTLKDIFALNLADSGGLRLAILSACETGLPGIDLPDEAISLPTGLLQAGAAAVISSLWSIDDRSTRILLTRFYDLWRKDHLEPSAALRQAQLWVRDISSQQKAKYFQETNPDLFQSLILLPPDYFAHPFHWAAFSYVGV